MTRSERAKQFMPFDAMKGLKEALAEREEMHLRVEKRDLGEDALERINNMLIKIQKGDSVELVCYRSFHEVTIRGEVQRLDPVYKYLTVDDTRISFDDIYDIKLI